MGRDATVRTSVGPLFGHQRAEDVILNDRMALNLLVKIMEWDEAKATREYAWLKLMAAMKYDGYADFRAGSRFVESLATWLRQFEAGDRPTAYRLVTERLTYISTGELHRVIEAFVPEVVIPRVRALVAAEMGIKPYEVWQRVDSASAMRRRLRQTLFVGMSDGSRIDVLRRSNAGRISTEQVVPTLNIDNEKWADLGKNLAEDAKRWDSAGRQAAACAFTDVYLVDDFTASGTTFVRKKADGGWGGKLKRFNDLVRSARESSPGTFPLANRYTLNVHFYIATEQARSKLRKRLEEVRDAWQDRTYGDCNLTVGLRLPPQVKLAPGRDDAALALCAKYYDHELFLRLERHCREAGQDTMRLGYADCALPVVLDHNTPNNSIPLLWAETGGKGGAHPMRPLFHRRDRHA